MSFIDRVENLEKEIDADVTSVFHCNVFKASVLYVITARAGSSEAYLIHDL